MLSKPEVFRLVLSAFPDLDYVKIAFSPGEVDLSGASPDFIKLIQCRWAETDSPAFFIYGCSRAYICLQSGHPQLLNDDLARDVVMHEAVHAALQKMFDAVSHDDLDRAISARYGVRLDALNGERFGEAVVEVFTHIVNTADGGQGIGAARAQKMVGKADANMVNAVNNLEGRVSINKVVGHFVVDILDAASRNEELLNTNKNGYDLLDEVMRFVASCYRPGEEVRNVLYDAASSEVLGDTAAYLLDLPAKGSPLSPITRVAARYELALIRGDKKFSRQGPWRPGERIQELKNALNA